MRKRIGFIAAIVLALGVLPVCVGVAFAVDNTEEFKASASPYKQLSTKKKKVGANLSLDITIKNPAGGKAAALNRVTILFPGGATVNTKAFPTCDPVKLEKLGPSVCTRAQIGTGTAVADASPILPRADAILRIFNGTPVRGTPRITVWANATSVSVTLVFSGLLTKQSGKYSYKLVLDVPHIPILPGNPDASVPEIHVKVGKKIKVKRKTINFIDSPRKCPTSGFPFHWDLGYWDGPAGAGDFLLPCP
jgi:hypothetical protein